VSYLLSRATVSFVLLLAAPSQPPSDDSIRQRTKEVLSRPEFRADHREDVMRRLLEWFSDLVGWLGGLRNAMPVLFWLLVISLSLILLLLLTHLGWTVYRTLIVPARGAGEELPEARRGRLSLAHHEEALGKAAEGEYTEAIRHLFLSLVYRFDESGRVSFQKAYTNREYLALFADRPDLHAELGVFVDTLDENWYGQHPTEERRYQNCLTLYQALQSV
jgi:hypothetical protein